MVCHTQDGPKLFPRVFPVLPEFQAFTHLSDSQSPVVRQVANMIRFVWIHFVGLIVGILTLDSRAACAFTYRVVEETTLTATLDGGHSRNGWEISETGRGLNRLLTIQSDAGAIVLQFETGDIRVFHRLLPLSDINPLLDEKLGADGPILDDGTGRFDLADFPFDAALLGPEAMENFYDIAADQPVYANQDPNMSWLGEYILPAPDALLWVIHDPIMVGKQTGFGTVHITVLKPVDDALTFTEDEVRPEDTVEFTEADVLDFILNGNDDTLKMMGCAAEISDCPAGVQADVLRDALDIAKDDDAARQMIFDIYREKQASQSQ